MRPPRLTARILDTLTIDGPQIAAQIAERLELSLRLTTANLWRMKNMGLISAGAGERPLVYSPVDGAADKITRRLNEWKHSLDEREHLLEKGVVIRFKNGSLAVTDVRISGGVAVVTGDMEVLQ